VVNALKSEPEKSEEALPNPARRISSGQQVCTAIKMAPMVRFQLEQTKSSNFLIVQKMSKGQEGMSGARSSCSSNHSYIVESAAFRAEARMTGERCKVRAEGECGESSAQPEIAPVFDLADCFARNIEFMNPGSVDARSRRELIKAKKGAGGVGKGGKSQFA